MSYIFLIAIKDDPSIISCYQTGNRIRVEQNTKLVLPLSAERCSDGTSFNLKHYDHFVIESDFCEHLMDIGEATPSDFQHDEQSGTSWWKYGLGVAAVAAVAAASYGGYRYYQSTQALPETPSKSLFDRFNPWYKEPVQVSENPELGKTLRNAAVWGNKLLGVAAFLNDSVGSVTHLTRPESRTIWALAKTNAM
jgi:hypothetical protein